MAETEPRVVVFTCNWSAYSALAIVAYQVLFQPLLIVLGLGMPLLLIAVVRKSPASRYYKYIFG